MPGKDSQGFVDLHFRRHAFLLISDRQYARLPMNSPVSPPKMRGLPRFLPGSPGARAAADARKATKPIAGVIQTGQYPDRGAISSARTENIGENRPSRYLLANNYHLVRADATLLLDSADHCGFTLSNPMALPPEPVPVDPTLWRAVFPPHLPEAIAKAGRWLFRGKPPDVAFTRGADEVATRRAASERGREEVIRATFRTYVWPDDTPEQRRAVAECIADMREVIAAHAEELRGLLDGVSDPPSDEDVSRIGAAAIEFSRLADWMPSEAAAIWMWAVTISMVAEDMTLRALEADLKGCLIAAAAEWKSLPSRYRAEDETPAEGENTFVLSNEKMRIVRELAAVWPDDAIWPTATWTAEDRAAVEEARHAGRGAETEIMRQATVTAAAERIMTLNDEMQDYREPAPGETPRTPGRRMRVLLGTLDEIGLASPDNVPARARDAFRAAARRHCDRLWEEYRQANAYRQRTELAEAEAAAARTAERDDVDRAAGTAHAASNASR
jgi:hypothetical protein